MSKAIKFSDIQIIGICRDWMNITLVFDCSESCKYLFLTKRPKTMFILFHHIFWLRIFLLFFKICILVIKANIDWMKLTKIAYFSPLIHCWNNVVNQLLMCQCWINDVIMLSINRWCVNVESTMMQRWRCNLTIYQHINVDSTLFQPTMPAGDGD